jgi:hypothetical protein
MQSNHLLTVVMVYVYTQRATTQMIAFLYILKSKDYWGSSTN